MSKGTKLFIDTKFNGFAGKLISMAIVSEDGREWYGVLPEPKIWDKWVFENVRPVLFCEPFESKEDFRNDFMKFLSQFENPEICADWYTDLLHFFSCFEGKDHTESFSYACTTSLVLIDDIKSAVPHNALSDARAIRAAWSALS